MPDPVGGDFLVGEAGEMAGDRRVMVLQRLTAMQPFVANFPTFSAGA